MIWEQIVSSVQGGDESARVFAALARGSSQATPTPEPTHSLRRSGFDPKQRTERRAKNKAARKARRSTR